MGSTPIIRIAVTNDLPAIVDIYNSTVPSRMVTADMSPVTVESRLSWFQQHDSGSRPIWVVEVNGLIAGWISLSTFYGRPAYQATVELSVYIHENYRKTGLGRLLMQHSIDACPQLNIKTILCFIFGHNDPSLRLIRSFGFDTWGEFPRIAELEGIERDLIVLGKRIEPA
jgi:L-amino acid N-acyltransferase YncA